MNLQSIFNTLLVCCISPPPSHRVPGSYLERRRTTRTVLLHLPHSTAQLRGAQQSPRRAVRAPHDRSRAEHKHSTVWFSKPSAITTPPYVLLLLCGVLLLHRALAMADASKALQLAEGQQMMAHLQEAGVIGIRRSVRVRARHVPSSLTAPSLEPGEKLVHFQRHGQGYHNLLGEIYRGLNLHFDSTGEDPTNSPYVLSELVDPPLTQKGRDQCVAARAAAELVSPQKIIVSPLCRAVQTAILTFDKSISDSRVSVIAHEDIRESFGRHTCDKRRTVSESKREFRDVDFSLIATDEDTWWQADV
eukprot:6058202-Pleurochrysis_carterae.AAC.2